MSIGGKVDDGHAGAGGLLLRWQSFVDDKLSDAGAGLGAQVVAHGESAE